MRDQGAVNSLGLSSSTVLEPLDAGSFLWPRVACSLRFYFAPNDLHEPCRFLVVHSSFLGRLLLGNVWRHFCLERTPSHILSIASLARIVKQFQRFLCQTLTIIDKLIT